MYVVLLVVVEQINEVGRSLDLIHIVSPDRITDTFLQQLQSARLHPLIVYIEVSRDKVR